MKMKTKNILLITIGLIVLAIVIIKVIIPALTSKPEAPPTSSTPPPLGRTGTIAIPGGTPPTPPTGESAEYYRMKEQFRFYRRIQIQAIKEKMKMYMDSIMEWVSNNVGKVKAVFDGLGIKLCDLIDKGEDELLDWFDNKGTAFLDKILDKLQSLPVIGEKINTLILKYEEENDVDVRDVIIGFLSAFVTDEIFNQGSRVRKALRCK
jgi:hypothetical protein